MLFCLIYAIFKVKVKAILPKRILCILKNLPIGPRKKFLIEHIQIFFYLEENIADLIVYHCSDLRLRDR